MTDERIDFSQLEPPDGDALVRAIEASTTGLLAERRARATTIQLAAWWPSVAAAAVLVAIGSALVLTLAPRPTATQLAPAVAPSERTQLARGLGVPPALALSLTRETRPTAREFLRELGR
jgi:hypothetical protein